PFVEGILVKPALSISSAKDFAPNISFLNLSLEYCSQIKFRAVVIIMILNNWVTNICHLSPHPESPINRITITPITIINRLQPKCNQYSESLFIIFKYLSTYHCYNLSL